MEANGVDGLVLNHGVRVVRVHTEVQLVRGRITALIGVNRVGLILGVDRRCTADRTARDAHAGWQSRVCFPRNRRRCRQGDVVGCVRIVLPIITVVAVNRIGRPHVKHQCVTNGE